MGQYKSQYTGPQIDAGINAALNPDVSVTQDSDALVTSGAVADALDNIDPTITSNTDTTLNGILVGNGSKVGTKSLDTSSLTNDADHVPVSSVVKSALDAKADQTDLATIHQTSPTCTETNGIAAGVFFYLDNELVVAKTAIANGATFTLNTNYEPPTVGSLNSLRSAIDELTTPSDAHQIRGSGAIYYVVGKTVILSFAGGIALDSNGFVLNNNGTKFQFPSNHLPKRDFYFFIATSGNTGADPYLCEISTSGTIKIYTRTYINMEYAYGSCSFPIN